MANDEHDIRERRQWPGISSQSVVAVLVAVIILAVIYAAGMMMWVDPATDRATTTGTVQTRPATPPTVSPPPLTPSQQSVPQPVTPAPDPQANPPRSGGG